jgi:uncharacterized damage-inducible protein DinB
MQREDMAEWWREAWNAGLWAAPWGKALEGLTPEQAAWRPAPGRHSIWQHVAHMCFWREDALARLDGKPKPTTEELATGNFPQQGTIDAAAWQAMRDRFRASQERIAAALADGRDHSRLQWMIPHDCYHMGQISLLRALQGLAPIE